MEQVDISLQRVHKCTFLVKMLKEERTKLVELLHNGNYCSLQIIVIIIIINH